MRNNEDSRKKTENIGQTRKNDHARRKTQEGKNDDRKKEKCWKEKSGTKKKKTGKR